MFDPLYICPKNSPNVDAGSSKSLALDNGGLDAKLVAGHARRGKASATAANDEVIGLLGDGSHGARRCGQVPGE